ncbi:anillin-like isoform X2 [Photinus pyralis]|nr:anillin-like isoform X2 [Photinus pyralis]
MEEQEVEDSPNVTLTRDEPIIVVESAPASEKSSSDDDAEAPEEKAEYDVQQFLFDALGGELHNYPSNSEVQSDLHNYNYNDDFSIGTSNISTLLSKSNSSYSHFSRKMRRCNTYASSTMYDKVTIDDDSIHPEDSKAAQYISEAARQHHIIIQASKALNLCLSCKEFKASTEYAEAERILLLAIEKREAVLRELKMVEYEDLTEDCYSVGHVKIGNLLFHPIRTGNLKTKLITQCFFAIASCGPHVLATEIAKLDDQNRINFNKCFMFDSLPSDFEIIIKLYYLNILNAKRLAKTDTTMCPSPNHILGFYKKSETRSRRLYSYERREPSFNLYGAAKVVISDLAQCTFNLTNCNESLGSVDLQITSSIELSLTHKGFLTIGSEAGGLAVWNRRWCLLDGSVLKYWNYPQDSDFSEPVNTIDLSYCVISSISRANRELCARPRTLVIETGRPSNSDATPYTITRHYLSADSVEEMETWERLLNYVLSSLRNWNCMNFQLNCKSEMF